MRLVHEEMSLQRQRMKRLRSRIREKAQIRLTIRTFSINGLTASLAPGTLRNALVTSEAQTPQIKQQ